MPLWPQPRAHTKKGQCIPISPPCVVSTVLLPSLRLSSPLPLVTMVDYYAILEVGREASQAEVKKA